MKEFDLKSIASTSSGFRRDYTNDDDLKIIGYLEKYYHCYSLKSMPIYNRMIAEGLFPDRTNESLRNRVTRSLITKLGSYNVTPGLRTALMNCNKLKNRNVFASEYRNNIPTSSDTITRTQPTTPVITKNRPIRPSSFVQAPLQGFKTPERVSIPSNHKEKYSPISSLEKILTENFKNNSINPNGKSLNNQGLHSGGSNSEQEKRPVNRQRKDSPEPKKYMGSFEEPVSENNPDISPKNKKIARRNQDYQAVSKIRNNKNISPSKKQTTTNSFDFEYHQEFENDGIALDSVSRCPKNITTPKQYSDYESPFLRSLYHDCLRIMKNPRMEKMQFSVPFYNPKNFIKLYQQDEKHYRYLKRR